jgi:hypothetical protein
MADVEGVAGVEGVAIVEGVAGVDGVDSTGVVTGEAGEMLVGVSCDDVVDSSTTLGWAWPAFPPLVGPRGAGGLMVGLAGVRMFPLFGGPEKFLLLH